MSAKEQIQTLSAEVKPLAELLQYQDSAILSRVLLKNKGGTVTLFAFDQGEGLSEHIPLPSRRWSLWWMARQRWRLPGKFTV